MMQELPQERLLIADMAIASCEWMFEESRAYVRQRKAFGRHLSNLQVGFLKAPFMSIDISEPLKFEESV